MYLGKPLTVAVEPESHVKEVIETYSDLLDKIVTSVALIAIKLEALEVIALSKIIHHFANTRLTEQPRENNILNTDPEYKWGSKFSTRTVERISCK